MKNTTAVIDRYPSKKMRTCKLKLVN